MTQKLPDCNPAYGLPDDLREEILKDAEKFGVNKAALIHNVHRTTIFGWRRMIRNGQSRETNIT